MGCLPWVAGGIAWAVTVAVTDNGWLGFVVGVGLGILVYVVARRIQHRTNPPATTRPPDRTDTETLEKIYTRPPMYGSHCWHCQSPITSATHRKCPKCRWYICNKCGECGCRYKRFEKARRRQR